MDLKPLIVQKMRELVNESSEMSFGEILYTLFRKNVLKSKPDDAKTSWLLDVKDEDFYTALEKTIEIEKESKE